MKTIVLLSIICLLVAACGTGPSTQLTADQIIDAFKAAGLEAEGVRLMTKDDYGMAPFVCKGVRFFIPSLGEDQGGRLFICDNAEDRDALAKYYNELGQTSTAFFSWVYVNDNILVQINGNLPEEQARKYEAAFNGPP